MILSNYRVAKGFCICKVLRKSNVKTDLEFYELRYGGKPAKFLRKFRAIYLGVIFNVINMSAVTLTAIKIGGIILGLEAWQTIVSAGAIIFSFSALGGFKGFFVLVYNVFYCHGWRNRCRVFFSKHTRSRRY